MSRPEFKRRAPDAPIRDAGAHIEIPAGTPAGDSAGRSGSSPRSFRRWIAHGWAWLEDGVIGDVIGCACLFAIIITFIIITGVLG
jgi:hypothetical protein